LAGLGAADSPDALCEALAGAALQLTGARQVLVTRGLDDAAASLLADNDHTTWRRGHPHPGFGDGFTPPPGALPNLDWRPPRRRGGSLAIALGLEAPSAPTAEAASLIDDLVEAGESLLSALVLEAEHARIGDERRALEARLAETEAFRVQSQSVSRTGSWTWNPMDPGVCAWSPELYNLLGHDPETTAPSQAAHLERVHPEDRDGFQAHVEDLATAGQFDLEYRYRLPDGAVRTVRALGRRVHAGLCVATASDITDRRRAQAQARRAHAELAAASRLATLGELAASITHELNQPLTAIVAHAGAGARWLQAPQPERGRAKSSIEATIASVQHAQTVIASLRALARKSEPERRPLDLDAAVLEVAALLRAELSSHGVELIVGLEGRQAVMADRVQLQQVVMTLVMACLEGLPNPLPARAAIEIQTGGLPDGQVGMWIGAAGLALDPSRPATPRNLLEARPSEKGLALMVCRAIVEAHEGVLRVGEQAGRAGYFEIGLPAGAGTR